MCQPNKSDDASADNTRTGFVWGFIMLVTGTFCTILTKAQYGIRAEGRELCFLQDGSVTNNCLFDKPWFGVLQMKFGMAGCLLVVWIERMVKNRRKQQPANGRDEYYVSWNTIFWFLVPAALDLLCTVLANVGLLWISSSIHQMTKGSLVIFNAYILIHFMGRRLFAYQLVSIGLVVVAITLVAYVGLLHSNAPSTGASLTSTDHANIVFGFICILLSQFVTAWQIVVEEWLLTERQVDPGVLVGWEGLWGLVFFVVLAPLLMSTPAGTTGMAAIWHEDFIDTFQKLGHSSELIWTILLYCVCTGLYNFSANCVTKYLSAVMSCILDTCRALGIWLVALIIYYVLGWTESASAGEPWTAWSWLELAGFIVLTLGTLMYKKVIVLPIASLYEAEKLEQARLAETIPLIPSTV